MRFKECVEKPWNDSGEDMLYNSYTSIYIYIWHMYHVSLYIHREKFMPGLLLRLIIFVAGRAELKAFKKALILVGAR